jgi:hypothetical protein
VHSVGRLTDAARAERWSARDGWQPAWQGATSAILQTGDFERVADDEVPAIQTRMAADAARYATNGHRGV